MRHIDPRNVIVILVLLAAAILGWRNRRKVLGRNLQLLAGLIQGTIEFPWLGLPLYSVVTGQYKGRRVTFSFNLLTRREGLRICMEAMGLPESRNFFGLWNGGPTDETSNDGNKIYYTGLDGISTRRGKSGHPNRPSGLLWPLVREDIAYYLDHLTIAAEQMEKESVTIPVG